AAYRSGEKLTNEWDGRAHDYTRKGGIVHTEIILPANAPHDFYDRATLWNSVEMSEKAANAQLAREVEVALPNELNREEQLKLVREFVKDTFVDAGMCADIAVHDKGDGNPHAHIMLTLRPLNPDGTWGAKCRKAYELDADGNRIPDGKGGWKNHRENTTDWNDKGNAEKWRASWAAHLNKALELKGVSARVDHRSYKRQGIDKIPSIHMGVAAMRMEKRGIRTIKGDFNRAIAADNKLLKELKARITRLYNWSKELAAREKALSGRKQSVMAQLMDAQFARQKEKPSNSNYAAIRRLKENAAVFNFLMEHNINSVEELFDVISDLNDRYYDLRGKIVNAERRIAALRERLDKLKQYRSYKAVRQKIDTLNGKKRALYEEQHKAELAAFASAEKYLTALREAGEKVKPEEWRKETERLNAEREANYKRMEDMREQIKAAENIRKDAERIAEWNQQEEMKRDAPSL
ncbi:MAG: MobA/MobL family protein, partial [Abditibacteriota bacterium]|nr:MobA/MobL family protein [Abditibacteriota bacterium]